LAALRSAESVGQRRLRRHPPSPDRASAAINQDFLIITGDLLGGVDAMGAGAGRTTPSISPQDLRNNSSPSTRDDGGGGNPEPIRVLWRFHSEAGATAEVEDATKNADHLHRSTHRRRDVGRRHSLLDPAGHEAREEPE